MIASIFCSRLTMLLRFRNSFHGCLHSPGYGAVSASKTSSMGSGGPSGNGVVVTAGGSWPGLPFPSPSPVASHEASPRRPLTARTSRRGRPRQHSEACDRPSGRILPALAWSWAHLARRRLLDRCPRCSCRDRRRPWPQFGDQPQDLGEQRPRHGNLGHPARHGSG
jgi:hypothetical protein